jgi:hypothetical protein
MFLKLEWINKTQILKFIAEFERCKPQQNRKLFEQNIHQFILKSKSLWFISLAFSELWFNISNSENHRAADINNILILQKLKFETTVN